MAYKYRRGRSLILAGYYLEIQDECCRNQVIFAVPSMNNALSVHNQITASGVSMSLTAVIAQCVAIALDIPASIDQHPSKSWFWLRPGVSSS